MKMGRLTQSSAHFVPVEWLKHGFFHTCQNQILKSQKIPDPLEGSFGGKFLGKFLDCFGLCLGSTATTPLFFTAHQNDVGDVGRVQHGSNAARVSHAKPKSLERTFQNTFRNGLEHGYVWNGYVWNGYVWNGYVWNGLEFKSCKFKSCKFKSYRSLEFKSQQSP
jgi:hypothetical protein